MTASSSNELPTCITHGSSMVQTPVGPTCLQCVREKVEKENRDFAREATLSSRLSETYHLLKRRSIMDDDTLIEATFENFSVDCEEQRINLERAQSITRRVANGEQANIWLIGETGRGKSHIAMAILKELNEAGKRRIVAAHGAGESLNNKATSSLFMNFDKMLRLIRKSYKDKDSEFTEDYFVSLCAEVDFLAIDDLGAETGAIDAEKSATDFVHRMLYAITNARRGKTTIITTNLYKEQRENMYDSKIISRLSTKIAAMKFEESPDMRVSAFEW